MAGKETDETPAAIEALKAGLDSGAIQAKPKTFASGSVGFNLNGQVAFGGAKYQVGANMTKIGSKPKA